MSPLFLISRNFVEFGAFTAIEVASFHRRGILGDHDYVRSADAQDWQPVGHWMSGVAPALLEGPPAPKAKSSAPRKRSTPAAKAPKKAA